MGLRGSHKILDDGKVKLLEICCNSSEAQKSKWKDAGNLEAASNSN